MDIYRTAAQLTGFVGASQVGDDIIPAPGETLRIQTMTFQSRMGGGSVALMNIQRSNTGAGGFFAVRFSVGVFDDDMFSLSSAPLWGDTIHQQYATPTNLVYQIILVSFNAASVMNLAMTLETRK